MQGMWVVHVEQGSVGRVSLLGVGWCYVFVSCESGLFVYMSGTGLCILC